MNYELITIFLLFAMAYLVGSIPTAVWVGKIFYKKDVRNYGSGNAGATNTFRVLGKKAGIPVLLFDIIKGWFVVAILASFLPIENQTNTFITYQIGLGICAVLGHIFPIFAQFKGGKGVATLFGIIIALHWQSSLCCIGVFVIIFYIFRIVSLSSIISALCFPIFVIFVFKTQFNSLLIFSIVISILILITHKANIKRIIAGEESKLKVKD